MIAIENIQSLGPWGLSRDTDSLLIKQLFANNPEELPWQYSSKTLEDQILENSLDGTIKDKKLVENLLDNLERQNLPRDTLIAIHLVTLILESCTKSQLNLVCASFPTYVPDNMTVKYESELPSYSKLASAQSRIQPYNFSRQLPNQLISNLAIHFGFQGNLINFCGNDSSFSAIESAMRTILNGSNDEMLFVGSFCYTPSIIFHELTAIIQSAADSFKMNQIPLNEWVGVTRLKKLRNVKSDDCILLALNSYRLNIKNNLSDQVFEYIEELTKSANKAITDIDLVLINDPSNSWLIEHLTVLKFFRPDVKIVDFYERLGNSLNCRFIQSLELLQAIYKTKKIPRKIRPNFRQTTQAVHDNEKTNFNGRFCLIICSSSEGELHMGLVEKLKNED